MILYPRIKTCLIIVLLNCRVFTNSGVDVGLVGCVMSLRIDSKEAQKEFNLMFPGSDDVIGGTGIGKNLEQPEGAKVGKSVCWCRNRNQHLSFP